MQSSSSLLSEEKERQFDDIASWLEEIVGFPLIHNITACPNALDVWL